MKQMKLGQIREKEVKTGIISILLAAIMVLIACLPAMAQDSEAITITMTGAKEVSITLTPTNWSPVGAGGKVSPNQIYETDPGTAAPIYFTLTNTSNCNVNTFIVGEDAVCVDKPAYKWILSADGQNSVGIYVLWFKVKDDIYKDYFLITKTQSEFWPCPSGGSNLPPGAEDAKKFGLKLLTPQPDFTTKDGTGYFSIGDATMKTTITISAVAA